MKQKLRASLVIFVCLLTLTGFTVMAREANPPEEPLIIPLGEENDLWEMDELVPGKPGGEIKYSAERLPQTFNDLLGETKATKDVTRMIMGAGLTARNPVNGRPVPAFARSWTISEDGLTYTFHLRKGLKFSDGRPLTAEDVVFTYEDLVFNPEVETEKRSTLRISGELPEVKAIDDLTVQFVLPEPYGPFLTQVSTGIYPEHKFEFFSGEKFNEAWDLETAEKAPGKIVGAGPFKLEKFVSGEEILLTRNPYYYKTDSKGTQLPYLDRYRVFKVKDNNVEFLKFKNGETEIFRPQIQDMPYLLSQMDEEGWKVTTGNGRRGAPLNADFLTFNWNANSEELGNLFRKSEFRRAVSFAVNREEIIDKVFNSFGQVQYGPISRLSPYHNSEIHELLPMSFMPDRAREILNELELKDDNGDGIRELNSGEPIEFSITVNTENRVRKEMAEIIVEGLKEIGIEAKKTEVPYPEFSSRLVNGNYQAAIVRVLANSVEPSTLSDLFTTDGPLHLWNLNPGATHEDWEKEIDKLFREGLNARNFTERRSSYARFQKIYAEELPVIYLAGESFLYATSPGIRNTDEFSRLGTFLDFAEYVWIDT